MCLLDVCLWQDVWELHPLCTQDFNFCVPLCARIMACEPPAKKRRLKSSGLHGGDCTLKKEETGSGLRMWLLEQFAWGHLSTMQIQKNSRAGSVGCKDFEDQGFGRDWSGWNCRTACNSAFPILEDVSRFCASV